MKHTASPQQAREYDEVYPRVNVRVEPPMMKRLNALKGATGLSHGAIVKTCVKNFLAVLEERHGVR